jgi:hypothetical protein
LLLLPKPFQSRALEFSFPVRDDRKEIFFLEDMIVATLEDRGQPG